MVQHGGHSGEVLISTVIRDGRHSVSCPHTSSWCFHVPSTVLALADHGTASSDQTGHAFSYGHWRPEVSGPTTKKKPLLSAFCITQCMSKHLASEECLLAAGIHTTPSPDSWKLSRCGEHPQLWELKN